MDREALLEKLGLTSEELQDFLRKFNDFKRTLNPAQLQILVRSLPSLEQARRSLGPTDQDLADLFRDEADKSGDVVMFLFEGTTAAHNE